MLEQTSHVQRSPAMGGSTSHASARRSVQRAGAHTSYAEGAAALAPREGREANPVQMERGRGQHPAAAPEVEADAPESAPGPAAPLPGAAGVIQEQMQAGGIRIVLAKLPPDPGPVSAGIARRFTGRTLGELLDAFRTQLGHLGGFQTVARGADRTRVLTAADTTIFNAMGLGVSNNDNAFQNWGTNHARSRRAIGPGLAVGQPVLYTEQEDPLMALQAIAVAARSQLDAGPGAAPPAAPPPPRAPAAPAPGAAPAQQEAPAQPAPGEQTVAAPAPGRRRVSRPLASTRNVAELAIFTHGWHNGIALGRGVAPGNEMAARLSPACAPGVNVQLFACSAAGGDNSFAEQLAAGLAQGGHDARVFGHTSAGRADTNGNGREFTARAGEHGAHGATNYQVVFDDAYVHAQTRALTAQLAASGHDATAVEAAMRRVLPHWCAVAMATQRVTPRGGGAPKPATMAIGYARAETIATIRAHWENPAQGLETVRNALAGDAAPARNGGAGARGRERHVSRG